MRSKLNLHLLPWTAGVLLLAGTLPIGAQPLAGTGSAAPSPQPEQGPGYMASNRPPMERAFRRGPHGRWWDDPQVAQKLGLSADQQKKMDDIFLQSRLTLIDKHAALEKEETLLDPLISADQPDEGRILAQIDKVAQARAELEKANARMLLGLRGALTPSQWKALRAMAPRHEDHFLHRDMGGPGGPGGRPGPPEGPGDGPASPQ